MNRGTPIEILTNAADTQHTACLTWGECNQILAHFDYLEAKVTRETEARRDERRRMAVQIDERIERLEEVAERWDRPGSGERGYRALARRARDKAEGLRVARRLLAEGGEPE